MIGTKLPHRAGRPAGDGGRGNWDLQRETANPLILLSANSGWNIVNFRGGLIGALRAAGYRIAAVVPGDHHAEALVQGGTEIISVPIDSKGMSPLRDLLLTLRYRRALQRARPSAALFFTAKPNIYGSIAAASLGIPVINNISGLGTAFIAGGWLERVVTALYRVALRRSATVFFQNRDDLAMFVARGLVRPDQARLLNGSGVDLGQFEPAAARVTPGPPTFLLVARMLWDKGIGEFVDAARIVRRQLPGARFLLLGPLGVANRSAVPAQRVEAWVAEGVVEYLGEQVDVRPFVSEADCVVLPSYREGLPRTLIEAAAMGRPAITTDVPGCRAAVDDGITGFLCESRSGASLAEAMLRFAGLDEAARQTMGDAARAKAVREFDERDIAAAYIDALARAGAGAGDGRDCGG